MYFLCVCMRIQQRDYVVCIAQDFVVCVFLRLFKSSSQEMTRYAFNCLCLLLHADLLLLMYLFFRTGFHFLWKLKLKSLRITESCQFGDFACTVKNQFCNCSFKSIKKYALAHRVPMYSNRDELKNHENSVVEQNRLDLFGTLLLKQRILTLIYLKTNSTHRSLYNYGAALFVQKKSGGQLHHYANGGRIGIILFAV